MVPCPQLKEQISELSYASFVDAMKGYTLVKNSKRVAKHLERMQNQFNIAEVEDKVFMMSLNFLSLRYGTTYPHRITI